MENQVKCLICDQLYSKDYSPLCSVNCTLDYINNRYDYLQRLTVLKGSSNDDPEYASFISSNIPNIISAGFKNISKERVKAIIEDPLNKLSTCNNNNNNNNNSHSVSNEHIHSYLSPLASSHDQILSSFENIFNQYISENQIYSVININSIVTNIDNTIQYYFPYDKVTKSLYISKVNELLSALSYPQNNSLIEDILSNKLSSTDLYNLEESQLFPYVSQPQNENLIPPNVVPYSLPTPLPVSLNPVSVIPSESCSSPCIESVNSDQHLYSTISSIETITLPIHNNSSEQTSITPSETTTTSSFISVSPKDNLLQSDPKCVSDSKNLPSNVEVSTSLHESILPSLTTSDILIPKEDISLQTESLNKLSTIEELPLMNSILKTSVETQKTDIHENNKIDEQKNETISSNTLSSVESIHIYEEPIQSEINNNVHVENQSVKEQMNQHSNSNLMSDSTIHISNKSPSIHETKMKMNSLSNCPLMSIHLNKDKKYSISYSLPSHVTIKLVMHAIDLSESLVNQMYTLPSILRMKGKAKLSDIEKYYKEVHNDSYEEIWFTVTTERNNDDLIFMSFIKTLSISSRIGVLTSQNHSDKIYLIPPAIDSVTKAILPTLSYVSQSQHPELPYIIIIRKKIHPKGIPGISLGSSIHTDIIQDSNNVDPIISSLSSLSSYESEKNSLSTNNIQNEISLQQVNSQENSIISSDFGSNSKKANDSIPISSERLQNDYLPSNEYQSIDNINQKTRDNSNYISNENNLSTNNISSYKRIDTNDNTIELKRPLHQ